MGRKLVVLQGDGAEGPAVAGEVLDEVDAHDEAQLQERMKEQPELFPLEEMDLTGPLLVVGREVRVPSGAIDLLGVTRDGDIVVIEFKTGPQNPDFRSALSQVVDYGADLWRTPADVFEQRAVSYFASERCAAGPVKGAASLTDAASAIWTDWDEEEQTRFEERLASLLESGSFRFVIVAQRFTEPMEKTAEYLNDQSTGASFYLVELVRFAGAGFSAFEARTILKPTAKASRRSVAGAKLDEQSFLDQIEHEDYREALADLFAWCRANNLVTAWGNPGVSVRVKLPGRAEPVSIAWANPPGVQGWYGLTALTLGYDESTAKAVPGSEPLLKAYVDSLQDLPAAMPLKHRSLRGVRLDPDAVEAATASVRDRWEKLLKSAAAAEASGTKVV